MSDLSSAAKRPNSFLETKICAADSVVVLTSERGERHVFIIDDQGPVLGIDTVPASSGRAAPLLGKEVGAELEELGPQGQKSIWKLTSLTSKYLHVLHVLMNEFQIRYPGADGLWRLDVKEGDIKPILDMVRDRAESNRETVRDLYLDKKLPLCLVGKALGADEFWLAQYLRDSDLDLATCSGTVPETNAGIALIESAKGTGAVLDPYTAWACADLGLLESMQIWFGTISVSQSAIDRIDNMIAQESTTRPHEGISWQKGQFVRHTDSDEYAKHRHSALKAFKADLLLHCEIVPLAMPDDVAETIADAIRKFGPEPFETIYLAAERGALLISDDLYYRLLANACAKVHGAWIQAFLMAAQRRRDIELPSYAEFVSRLASYRHYLVQFDASVLIHVFESNPDPELRDFQAVCRYLGGAAADMRAHVLVLSAFLEKEWNKFPRDPRLPRTSSILLDSILRERADWAAWLALVWCASSGDLRNHIVAWVTGHFLPTGELEVGVRNWFTRVRATRALKFGAMSWRALAVAESRPRMPANSDADSTHGS
jgi:cellulose synthase operon protein C